MNIQIKDNKIDVYFGKTKKIKGVIEELGYPLTWVAVQNINLKELPKLAKELFDSQKPDKNIFQAYLKEFFNEIEKKLYRPYIAGSKKIGLDPSDLFSRKWPCYDEDLKKAQEEIKALNREKTMKKNRV